MHFLQSKCLFPTTSFQHSEGVLAFGPSNLICDCEKRPGTWRQGGMDERPWYGTEQRSSHGTVQQKHQRLYGKAGVPVYYQ